METLEYTGTLTIIRCGSCQIRFAMPEDMKEARRATGEYFWCPNGCKIKYLNPENGRLKAKLERAEELLERQTAKTETVKRSLIATKGHLTRQRDMHARGECPVCGRVYKALARHVQQQHPEHAAEVIAE